jgi:hypothetical protein
MSTIHVLTETLKDGYAPILQYYNTNKPFHWNPILEGGFAEGGFEIKLEDELLQEAKNTDITIRILSSDRCVGVKES